MTHVRSCCFACYCFFADVIQTWNGEGGTNTVNGKINNAKKTKEFDMNLLILLRFSIKDPIFPLSLPSPSPLPLLKLPYYPLTTLNMQ